MILEQGHLYHIFNQGNNRQKIFFRSENYFYFLKKIKTYITPYADILAWCLMPNHFHLMVYIHQDTHRVTQSHPAIETHIFNQNSRSTALNRSTALSRTTVSPKLNKAIGILLTSYTQAINKQENRSGSLFKPHTKAECLSKSDGITPSFFNTQSGAIINIPIPEKEYPQACFNYIHNNPVIAGLAKNPEDWEFSSYKEHCGLRNDKLINLERTKEFGLKIIK